MTCKLHGMRVTKFTDRVLSEQEISQKTWVFTLLPFGIVCICNTISSCVQHTHIDFWWCVCTRSWKERIFWKPILIGNKTKEVFRMPEIIRGKASLVSFSDNLYLQLDLVLGLYEKILRNFMHCSLFSSRFKFVSQSNKLGLISYNIVARLIRIQEF